MSKKDYKLIAAVFAEQRRRAENRMDENAVRAIDATAAALALELQLDNPRFNRGTFLAAAAVAQES